MHHPIGRRNKPALPCMPARKRLRGLILRASILTFFRGRRTKTMSLTTAEVELSAPAQIRPRPPVARPTFLTNIATVLGGQIASAIVALGIEVCYARLLGPAGRGQISLCMMAIAMGTLIGGLGGEIPIVVWTADSKQKPQEWLPAVVFWGAVGSLAAVFLWTFIYWLWHPVFLRGITPQLAALVIAAIPVSIFFSYLVAILTGLERFRLRAGIALAYQAMELAAIVILIAWFGRSAAVAVTGILTGLLIGIAITAASLKEPLRGCGNLARARKKLGSALRLGLRGQLGDLATFFNYRLDVFIVNYFLGPAQVGIYTIGVIVSESIWQIPQAAAVALFPRTARTIDCGAAEFTCLVSRQVLLLALLLGVAMAISSPILIPLLFGARFNPAVAVIWWILPGTIALSLGKVMSADLAAREKPEYSSIFAFVSLVVTIILDFALIPRMGIQGAALASSIAYFVDSALLAVALKHVLKVTWKSFLLPTASEFVAYQRAWLRCMSWLRAAAASANTENAE
jgi:O-antigen/teichoic acid export membrane protein